MNKLGYLLNLVLACNVLLHERLSGSGWVEHTGSNTAGLKGKLLPGICLDPFTEWRLH